VEILTDMKNMPMDKTHINKTHMDEINIKSLDILGENLVAITEVESKI
jgi:hypothetical protein